MKRAIKRKNRFTIRLGVLLATSFAVLMSGFVGIVFYFMILKQHEELRKNQRERSIGNITILIENIKDSLYFSDLRTLRNNVDSFVKSVPYLSALEIFDSEGRRLVRYRDSGSIEFPVLHFEDTELRDDLGRPKESLVVTEGEQFLTVINRVLSAEQKSLGYVQTEFSFSFLESLMQTQTASLLLSVIMLAVIAIIGIVMMSAGFARALNRLLDVAKSISAGEYNLPVRRSFVYEYDRMSGELSNMADSIKDKVQKLRQSEEYAQTIIHSLSEALVVVDRKGFITFVNSQFLSVFGYPFDNIRSMKFLDIVKFSKMEKGKDFLATVVERSAVGEFFDEMEAVCLDARGSEIPVLLNCRFVSYKGLFVFSVKDQRDSKLLQELKKSQKLLIHSGKMAALGEMAGGVAHEINNPLGVIMLRAHQGARLLEAEPLDKGRIVEFFKIIEATGDRIRKIVEGLRFFSRGGGNDPVKPASVRKIVQDTLSLCYEQFTHRQISIRIADIPADVEIECRDVQIGQVMMNLLNNAFYEVMRLDDVDKWIDIRFEDCGDKVRLIVVDCGKGVPLEIRDKILQPFFTTKDVGVGTGLGLSIASGIIESHGGRFFLDETNPNTAFVIELPKLAASNRQ